MHPRPRTVKKSSTLAPDAGGLTQQAEMIVL
jgi:hypothetical protein